MCLHFYLVLFEQVGYSMFLVQYRKVFSDQYNFFERVDLAFALLYVYCVLRRMGVCVCSTVGVFSTVGDIMSTAGGYHEYRGGIS